MQKGFTIVELLVIVIVIGMLVAIGVVGYGGIQNNARDTAVQADLESMASQLEVHRTLQTNITQQFPNTTPVLESLQIKANKDSYDTTLDYNFVYCTDTTRQEFALVAASKSGNIYLMTEDGFRTHSLTAASFTASLCGGLGLSLVSNGYAGGSWQAWVKS